MNSSKLFANSTHH